MSPSPTSSTRDSLAASDRARFNEIATEYCRKDLSPVASIARKHRLLQTLLPLAAARDVSILEVGCGAGFSARYLQGSMVRFVGLDYAENLIDYAVQHNSGPGVSFLALDVKDHEPEEKYDIILMIGVLHHFDDPEGMLKRLASMLKPGGHVVSNEPQSANLLIRGLRSMRARVDAAYSPDQLQFSARELRQMHGAAGLVNVRLVPQGLLSTPLAEVILKPAFLFRPLAHLAVALDRLAEALLGRLLTPLSWNLVAIGQRPLPVDDPS